MRLRAPRPSRLAALLASLALVSVMAQPVLACDMGPGGQPTQMESAAADPHAHHGMAGTAAEPDEPAAPGAPLSNAPDCDHVVGCAVMALSSQRDIAPASGVEMDVARRIVDAVVDAPAPTVEPPPPRP